MTTTTDYKDIRKFRKSLHLSISAFSRITGINRNTISSWEKGKSGPSEAMLSRIYSKFDINPMPAKTSKGEGESAMCFFNSWKSFSKIKDQSVDNAATALSSAIHKIGNEIKKQNVINKAIFKYTESMVYIKNSEQKYLYANKTFLDKFSQDDFFTANKRTDYNYFSRQEALDNEKEDAEVFERDTHVHRQGYIPGTRKKKFGFIFKSLLKNDKGHTIGLLCEMFDVTYFNKIEELRIQLQKCIDKTDMFIWMGQGLSFNDKGYPHASKVLFLFGSKALTDFYGGLEKDSEHILSTNDVEKIAAIRALVPESQKIRLAKGIKDGVTPVIRQYLIKSPHTLKEINVLEFIYYEPKTEIMIGIIFSLPILPLINVYNTNDTIDTILKENNTQIADRLRALGVSEDIISKATSASYNKQLSAT